MRILGTTLGACLLVAAASPVRAANKFECARDAIPGAYKASPSGPDISGDAIVAGMRKCGLPLTPEVVQRLGFYMSIRRQLDEARSALKATYPSAIAKLDAAASDLDPASKAEILNIPTTHAVTATVAKKLLQITTAAGVPTKDSFGRSVAQKYVILQVEVARMRSEF